VVGWVNPFAFILVVVGQIIFSSFFVLLGVDVFTHFGSTSSQYSSSASGGVTFFLVWIRHFQNAASSAFPNTVFFLRWFNRRYSVADAPLENRSLYMPHLIQVQVQSVFPRRPSLLFSRSVLKCILVYPEIQQSWKPMKCWPRCKGVCSPKIRQRY
jgi:hypothetical protein